tara:strand:+ start:200893 stop:201285 length:393 start_codon:yes stop_codon:yes gene_type:complete
MADFIDDAIADAQVAMTVNALEDNTYKCDLASTHGSMTRTITMAEGYGPPKLGNLIYYYATEIQLYEDCNDILEWASDMGLNPGDSETLKRYDQLGEDHRELRMLLGEENYLNMIAALEISQALDGADPR